MTRPNRMPFDGYDANDPRAPDAYRCHGCDVYKADEHAWCDGCADHTTAWLDDGGQNDDDC